MNEVSRTGETYAHIAVDYAAARQDRAALQPYIEKFVSLVKPGGLVFDVGCGPGFDTAVLQQHQLRVVGLDYSRPMMLTGRDQYHVEADFVQSDMRRLPLGPDSADGLWVCASLLHLPRADVPVTLAGFHRILAPGGILMLAVKQGEGEEWAPVAYGHSSPRFFTYWQPDALDELLVTVAFDILDGWTRKTEAATWLARFARKRP
jgi:ubiquinone/menaquinone biosynthesis C-methylase UbiE